MTRRLKKVDGHVFKMLDEPIPLGNNTPKPCLVQLAEKRYGNIVYLNTHEPASLYKDKQYVYTGGWQIALSPEHLATCVQFEVVGTYVKPNHLILDISKDNDTVIVVAEQLNIHSTGNNIIEAIDNFKENLKCLIEDFQADGDFSEDWLDVKDKLFEFIDNKEGVI